jgi:hypothetical protein
MGIPTPRKGDAVTLTYVADRRSFGTALKVTSLTFQGSQVILVAEHVGSKELAGIDARLDNQRRSIQNLLEHLQKHCPQLQGFADGCVHMDKREEAK